MLKRSLLKARSNYNQLNVIEKKGASMPSSSKVDLYINIKRDASQYFPVFAKSSILQLQEVHIKLTKQLKIQNQEELVLIY